MHNKEVFYVKIWELSEDVNNYEDITLFENQKSKWLELNDMFVGKSLLDTWKPLKVKLIEHNGDLKRGDILYFTLGVSILSNKAVNALQDFWIKGKVELLPLIYDLQDVVLMNVLNIVDCINMNKSEIRRFTDSDKIKAISKYVFIPERVQNQHIFKIAQRPHGRIFVSDEFKNRVIESGLEGFKFIEVWDSEE